MAGPSARALGAGVLASVAAFVALYVTAIALYPGGTWFDRHAPGYDLLRNFVCDLTQPVALDGRPNALGSVFGKASMFAFDVGLALTFVGTLRLGQPTRRLRRLLLGLAALSFVGISAVPLLPSLVFGHLHTVAVSIGAAAGLIAGAFSVAVQLRSPYRRIARLGLSMFAAALTDAGIYAWSIAAGTTPLVLPMLQRLALVLVLAWMTATGAALFTLARDRDPSHSGAGAGRLLR